MKFQIKAKTKVMFEGEYASLKLCVEAAVQAKANLSRADLSRADLREANLSGADLSGVNLSRADLREANLSGAYLSGVNLSRADLSRADLSGANLSGANLSGANLSGANQILGMGYPNGWTAFAWHIKGEIQVRVGCRSLSLEEGRKYWEGKENRQEVLAALDYAEKVAKLRGWK